MSDLWADWWKNVFSNQSQTGKPAPTRLSLFLTLPYPQNNFHNFAKKNICSKPSVQRWLKPRTTFTYLRNDREGSLGYWLFGSMFFFNLHQGARWQLEFICLWAKTKLWPDFNQRLRKRWRRLRETDDCVSVMFRILDDLWTIECSEIIGQDQRPRAFNQKWHKWVIKISTVVSCLYCSCLCIVVLIQECFEECAFASLDNARVRPDITVFSI